MEILQLFTVMLMTIAGLHLLFSAVDVSRRWFENRRQQPALQARASRSANQGSWYVFFDPAVLYGKPKARRDEVAGRSQPRSSRGSRIAPRPDARRRATLQ